jgi:DeoR/GlpR family transcriptional regulator of sugar metabolism
MPSPIKGVASFYDRSKKNIREKRIIAQKAAHLLKDGQSIILDSSSTATFLLPYIAKLNSVKIFTNNLSTALTAIELGINTHCLGGRSINGSVVLSSTDTYETISSITADILFFSSQSVDIDGTISDSTEEENYMRRLMIKSAKKTVFLCDNEKFNKSSLYKLCNIDDIDIAVFDKAFDDLNTKCKIL